MTLQYKLEKDISSRTATFLCFELNRIKGEVHIKTENKKVSGKSLLGLLVCDLKEDDIITIETEMKYVLEVRDAFNAVGREV